MGNLGEIFFKISSTFKGLGSHTYVFGMSYFHANIVMVLLFFYFAPLIAAASLGDVFRVSCENRSPG